MPSSIRTAPPARRSRSFTSRFSGESRVTATVVVGASAAAAGSARSKYTCPDAARLRLRIWPWSQRSSGNAVASSRVRWAESSATVQVRAPGAAISPTVAVDDRAHGLTVDRSHASVRSGHDTGAEAVGSSVTRGMGNR